MDEEVLTPQGMERVFLLPGEMCVVEKPTMITTLLGSCVAVCVYNKSTGRAGMNHFSLDLQDTAQDPHGKYGDTSTTYLIQKLMSLDKSDGPYEAKIFGGAVVVGNLGLGDGIGADNINIARKVLNDFKIPIIEEDVGGNRGRKIYFNTGGLKVEIRAITQRQKDFSNRKIRVLIVDDSKLVRKILRKDIESSKEFEVCAEAADSFEARDQLLGAEPDVISLDIIMPGLNGLDFLEKIMRYRPTPVVIVSTIAKIGSPTTQRARKLGALGIIDKEELEIYKGIKGARIKYLAALKTAAKTIVNEAT